MRTFRSYNIGHRVGLEREMKLRNYRRLPISNAISVVGGAIAALSAAAASDAPTFNQQVAPILFEHCSGCHRAGEIGAPVSLLTFESTKSKAAAIKERVLKGAMPPWPADAAHSLRFRNDARLSEHDIHVLTDWVDAGAPRGPGVAPIPPEPAQGWLFPGGRAPDAVVTLPEVTLAASGEVPYILQRVKVPFLEDKWIVAMQVRPSNDAVVHHMGITEVTLAANINSEQVEQFSKMAARLGMPDGAINALRPAVTDPVNADAYDMLGVYTPGTTFENYPSGSAKLLKGGGNLYINANIHYTTTGKPEKDRSQIAMWFQPQPPDHQLFRAPGAVSTIIANGRELLSDDPGTKAEGTPVAIPPIPPFSQDFEIDGVTAYTSPVTIFQLQPHAHMRGKSFKYAVIYPDGHEITLLSVPNYDFHWQLAYDLETPLTLPAGSKLVVSAHYDNSARNPHLRGLTGDLGRNCGPDKQARFLRQNQSWDEMFSPIIQYSIDSNATAGRLPLVQTVGCLVHSSPAKWTLTRATDPHDTQTQSTSAAANASAADSPFGNGTFALLGTEAFRADRFRSQKVIVKGVEISAPTGNRINVTSLQPVNQPCQ